MKDNFKLWFCIMILSFISIFLIGLLVGKHCVKPIYVDLSETNITLPKEYNKYQNIRMPDEIADYIIRLCKELNINEELAVAILLNENPLFDANATNKNKNGTIDIGLYQLNDKYIWNTFVPRYWKIENVEFNPYNWKHNIFVALHHIQYLTKTLKVFEDIVAGYNCGENAVMNNKVPASTLQYIEKTKNNILLIRSANGQ